MEFTPSDGIRYAIALEGGAHDEDSNRTGLGTGDAGVLAALPYLLGFAAGAMVYVVVEELIPEMSEGKHSNLGTIAFSLGFVLMMVLDVALG